MTPALERENMIILQSIEAIRGVLSCNVLGLSVEFAGDYAVAHFLLFSPNADEEEELLENFPAEVANLMEGTVFGEVVVIPKIHLDSAIPSNAKLPGREVLRFRRSS